MKKLISIYIYFACSILWASSTTMEFNGTSTTQSGVTFSFTTGNFVNSTDGTQMSVYENHPYANYINGGNDYKDIDISQSILITSVNITWAVNVTDLKLQFLDGGIVIKELSSLTLGDVAVNATADKIRFYDGGYSSSGGFELATVTWDSPLPVELVNFNAFIASNEVQLLWETATEVNNYGFEIERTFFESNDKWVKVGFVEGHGNSNSPKKYSFTDKSLETSGKYSYRLKQIDLDGSYEYSDIVIVDISVPVEYELSQNYPNPFNPTTTITFSLPEKSDVKLIIYNMLGQIVKTVVNDLLEPGKYNYDFDASELSSGVYIYSLSAGNKLAFKKMTLTK